MDRHRRLFTFRPFPASVSGVSRPTSHILFPSAPADAGVPFSLSLSRSLSWNS
ncbi:protein YoaL [Siccibacter turicensis]|uniref:protein YoaL n=1 Tax=Siccibacter turicensis TaxID=357233 RepID=UPI0039088F40